jgi:hypothetical protein
VITKDGRIELRGELDLAPVSALEAIFAQRDIVAEFDFSGVTSATPPRCRRCWWRARSSTDDISSGRRGGLRSHRGAGGRTRDQLYNEAKKKA